MVEMVETTYMHRKCCSKLPLWPEEAIRQNDNATLPYNHLLLVPKKQGIFTIMQIYALTQGHKAWA